MEDHTRSPANASGSLSEPSDGDWEGQGQGGAPGVCEAGRGPCPDPSTFLIHEYKSSTREKTNTYEQVSGSIVEEGDRQGYAGLARRLERYAKCKKRSQEMSDWLAYFALVGLKPDDPPPGLRWWQQPRQPITNWREVDRIALELGDCGSHLCFRWYAGLDVVRLHSAHFCQRDKLCPFCALRRGAKFLRRYSERISSVLQASPALKAYMVTGTIRNGGDLSERFNHHRSSLRKAMARVRHQKAGQRATAFSAAVGGVGSYEFKRGRNSGGWHPHHHAVWLCDREPDQHALRQEWRDITGDSHIIDVRPLHYLRDGLDPTPENIASDAAEVFKYALKFSSMRPHDNWEAFEVLKGRRLINSWGALYGVPDPEDLADDVVAEDEPYIEWLYSYSRVSGTYQRAGFSR